MKKQLLTLLAILLIGVNQIFAQCSPDFSITTPGIYPDSLTNLDTGMVGQAYSDTIQAKVYSTVSGVTVDSIKVMGITGLPTGFTTASNPPGNVFNGGTNGCLLIQGTPATAGTFPLIVSLRVYGHIFTTPLAIDTTDDDYRIVVSPPAGIPIYNYSVFEVYQNFPNPFNGTTEIDFTTPVAGKVQFKVIDIIGKEIINRTIEAVPGVNRNYLNSRYFKPGIYFYSITNRSKTITRKMIVTDKP